MIMDIGPVDPPTPDIGEAAVVRFAEAVGG